MNLKETNPSAWQKFLKLNHNPDRVDFTSLSPFHNELNDELIGFLKDTRSTLNPRVQRRFVRLCDTAMLLHQDAIFQESQLDIQEIDILLDIMDWNSVDDESSNYEDTWMT